MAEPSFRTAWRFFDGTNEYLLPVNPDAAKMPSLARAIKKEKTAAGTPFLVEGRQAVQAISFSGLTLSEDQYRAFRSWYKMSRQIRITDDLNQVYWIYIKEFAAKRRKSTNYPWLMEYTASGIVLNR